MAALPPLLHRVRDAAPALVFAPAGLYMGGQEALQQVEELRITHILVRCGRVPLAAAGAQMHATGTEGNITALLKVEHCSTMFTACYPHVRPTIA
jgi:hypothetical protein